MSSIIFLILLLSKAPPGDISDLFSWHRLHGFAKDGRFQRAAFVSFGITQHALQMIDILFRRDDRIYNLISMLTPKKKDNKEKLLQDRCLAIHTDTVLHVLELVASLKDE